MIISRLFIISQVKTFTYKKAQLTAFLILLLSALTAPDAMARKSYDSYISPFANGQDYQLHVLGDSLGNGVAKALVQALAKKKLKVSVFNDTSSKAGFARQYSGNLNKKILGLIGTPIHIAVIVVGKNDTKFIYHNRKRYKITPDSSEWEQIYEQRINKFLKNMKKRQIAVYWVSMPIMRNKKFNNTLQLLNDVYRKLCYRNRVKFINTWNGFTDQYGNYSPFASDVEGQIKKLREKDGVHFTPDGYMKLAHYITREIERDLILAKEERNIPLAGDPKEQFEATKNSRSKRQNKFPSGRVGQRLARLRKKSINAKKNGKKQPADAPQRMKQNLAVVAASFGRSILMDINGGLTAIASISSTDNTMVDKRTSMRLLPLEKRPYYKVLVKGEPVSLKSGRADDFHWRN